MVIVARHAPKRRGQRGSALVELAITLMGFLLLTFGVIDFGMAVYASTTCVSTAEDAARWASVNGSQSLTPATSDSVTAYVKNSATSLDPAIDPSQLNVNTTWTPNNSPGSTVRVTVSYTFNPFSYVAMRQSINLSGTAQYPINH